MLVTLNKSYVMICIDNCDNSESMNVISGNSCLS